MPAKGFDIPPKEVTVSCAKCRCPHTALRTTDNLPIPASMRWATIGGTRYAVCSDHEGEK